MIYSLLNGTNDTAATLITYFRKMEEGSGGDLPPGAMSLDDIAAFYASSPLLRHFTTISIIKYVVAVVSFSCSVTLLWMIRRSNVGLSTVQNRILVGLSMGDIMNALGHVFSDLSNPSEMSYIVRHAHGTDSSCITNGFFVSFGFYIACFYNCSLNLYYLIVVKFEKSEEFIRTKIERFFHGISIAIALGFAIALAVNGSYNSDTVGNCTSPVNIAPHCVGYADGEIREGFEVPCGRGRSHGNTLFRVFITFAMIASAVIIIGSLVWIYLAVVKIEKKLQSYGASAIRSRIAIQQSAALADSETAKSGVWDSLKKSLSRKNLKGKPRSKLTGGKSRTVMKKAWAYSCSWFLTYIFMVIVYYSSDAPVAMHYLNHVFTVLQGFYNLIIYLYPKVIDMKNKSKREKITWWQAFVKAFWSRGPTLQRNGRNQNVSTRNRLRKEKKDRKGGGEEKKKVIAAPQAYTKTTGGSLTTSVFTNASSVPTSLQNSSKIALKESGCVSSLAGVAGPSDEGTPNLAVSETANGVDDMVKVDEEMPQSPDNMTAVPRDIEQDGGVQDN